MVSRFMACIGLLLISSTAVADDDAARAEVAAHGYAVRIDVYGANDQLIGSQTKVIGDRQAAVFAGSAATVKGGPDNIAYRVDLIPFYMTESEAGFREATSVNTLRGINTVQTKNGSLELPERSECSFNQDGKVVLGVNTNASSGPGCGLNVTITVAR